MRPDHVMNWSSTTKPLVAIALARLRERGLLSFDDPVARFLPDFAQRGKSGVTLRHCLIHTAGLWEASFAPAVQSSLSLAAAVEKVCSAPLAEDGTWPLDGSRAAYDSPAFQVLGRVVEECDPQGRSFGAFVSEEIFGPLGMSNCYVGMATAEYNTLRSHSRLAGLFSMHYQSRQKSADGARRWQELRESCAEVCLCDPSGNGRGPAEELVYLFDALAHDGKLTLSLPALTASGMERRHDFSLLPPGVVNELFATRWREGVVDELQGVDVAWSLGFAVGSILGGKHASPRTFGHGGSQSSFAFADPDNGVAVACICNGKPGTDAHYKRVAAIADAVYEDLGLVGSTAAS